MLSHYQTYMTLLQSEHFDQLKALFEAQNVHQSMNVNHMLLESHDGFPYVLLRIETEQVFAAQMAGLNLQIDSIVPECTDFYYMPVIAMADGYDEQINQMIDHNATFTHELLHIKDVLALCDSSDYAERITQYSLHKLQDSADLDKSIDIEVFKIFHLEPKAFASDFSLGEKTIRTSFLGMIMSYDCQTEQEYLHMQLREYLDDLSARFIDKFPDDKTTIETLFADCVTKYGKQTLGDDPMKKLAELRAEYPQKMLQGMMGGMAG